MRQNRHGGSLASRGVLPAARHSHENEKAPMASQRRWGRRVRDGSQLKRMGNACRADDPARDQKSIPAETPSR